MSGAGSTFLAYFYFDLKDTEKQGPRASLSSVLLQLSDQSDIFFDALFSSHKDGSRTPTDNSLTTCPKDMLTIMGQLLVMDALDECSNDSGIPSPREKVLDLVKQLVELRHPNLRLCIGVSSRGALRSEMFSFFVMQFGFTSSSSSPSSPFAAFSAPCFFLSSLRYACESSGLLGTEDLRPRFPHRTIHHHRRSLPLLRRRSHHRPSSFMAARREREIRYSWKQVAVTRPVLAHP